MNDSLIAPIAERITLGHDKEAIKREVMGFGYSAEEFESAYASALQRATVPAQTIPRPAESAAGVTPTPTSAATSAPVASTPTFTPTAAPGAVGYTQASAPPSVQAPTPTPTFAQPEAVSSKSKKGVLLGLGLFVGLVLVGGLAYAGYSGLIKIPFLGGAPFDEDRILEEVVLAFSNIDTARYTATIQVEAAPRDSDVYPFPEALRSTPEGEDYASDMEMLGEMVPSDFKAHIGVSGTLELREETSPASETQVIAEIGTDDFNMNVDVEFVTTEAGAMLVKVNRIPSLFMDLSSIKGEWVMIEEGGDGSDSGSGLRDELAAEDEELEMLVEQLQILGELAEKHQYFVVVGDPVAEEIDGIAAYRYQISINTETSVAFFKEAEQTLKDKYGEDSLLADIATEDSLELMNSNAYVEYSNRHAPLYIWATKDGDIARVAIDARLAPDADLAPALAERQINVYIALDLRDINMPIEVNVPEESLSLEEAAERVPMLGHLFGSLNEARTRGEDAAKQSTLYNFRAEAELYYDGNDQGYGGFCNYINSPEDGYYRETLVEWDFDCSDTPTTYMAEVSLSSGYFCIDSTGYAGESWLPSSPGEECLITE